jgi:hypothetical protein
MVISRWRTGKFVQGKSCRLNEFCRLLCIIASIEYIRRQIEESFTSFIKGLIRKFTEIHILTIQSGVNKRNKNRGEHNVIKHTFSIHSYIPVIKKYHGKQMQVAYDQTYSTFPFKALREPHKCVDKFGLCAGMVTLFSQTFCR